MNKIILATLGLIFALSACVPTSKYQEAQQATRDNQNTIDEQNVEIAQLQDRIAQLEKDLADRDKQIDALAADTALAGVRNRTLSNRLSVLENDLRALAAKMGDVPEYRSLMNHLSQMQDELVSASDKLVDSEKSLEDQKRLLAEANQALTDSENALAQSQNDLANKQQQIQDQQLALATAKRDNEQQAEQIAQQAARLAELEAALQAKDQAMADLKTKITNALSGFTSDELNVVHRDGRVYVSLEEKLLFASGQYDVNEKGTSAIKQIAQVLSTISDDISVDVEGHTDNVPLRGTVIADNWDLSAKRATSVVRILIAGGVDSSRVQAIGRGDTAPIASNDTAEGRTKNRRTEIILSPKLDAILSNL